MADDLTMYWRLAGRAFAPYMSTLPGGAGRIDAEGWISLTGEPIGSLNMAFVEDDSGAEGYLAGIADIVAEQGLPMIVLMAPALSARVAPVATALGLRASPGLPVMAMRPAGSGSEERGQGPYLVTRVIRNDERLGALRLQAETFGMPLASLERSFPAPFVNAPGFDLFLATRDGEPFSTVTTTTVDGVTGLWSMATPPARQRRGAGSAAFDAAIAYRQARGVERFYLGASPAGGPLYAKRGFLTIAETAVWEAGPA